MFRRLGRFRAGVVALAAFAVLAAGLPEGAAAGERKAVGLVLGFDTPSFPLQEIESAGARVREASPGLGVVLVEVGDAAKFLKKVDRIPGLRFVESNAVVSAATTVEGVSWDGTTGDATLWDATLWDGAGWDGAGWEGAGWDGAGWDGAGWDSTILDGAGWDGAGWDSAGWDSAGWDGAGWDSTLWDGAGWDSAGWDSTLWDGAGWDSTIWDGFDLPRRFGPDPGLPFQWGLGAIRALDAWTTTRGAGNVPLCFADTGIDPRHPDLKGRVLAGWNFIAGNDDPFDDAGHGTHVAGIAAARTGNAFGVAGVAQEPLLVAKVLDASGVGGEAELALAIRWCVDQGAKVVSLSAGSPLKMRVLERAVKYAADRDVLVVAAAGNKDACHRCLKYPAAYPSVLSVSAVRPDLSIAPFSNTGPTVDLAAPGDRILSTFPGGFAVGSGTSQAAPFVAGVAALVWEADPSLSAKEVRKILEKTARDLGARGRDATFGHGLVDAKAAVAAALGGDDDRDD